MTAPLSELQAYETVGELAKFSATHATHWLWNGSGKTVGALASIAAGANRPDLEQVAEVTMEYAQQVLAREIEQVRRHAATCKGCS